MGTTPQNEEQMVSALKASIAGTKAKRAADARAARLVRAAAPELLAVLEQVADFWAGGDVPEELDAAMRAAIKKARGE